MAARRILFIQAALFAFLLLFSMPAGAQMSEDAGVAAGPEGPVTPAEDEDMPSEVDSFVRVMPKQDASSQAGGVGVVEAAAEYNYQAKAFGKIPVEFSLESQYIGLNNSTQVFLPARLVGFSTGIDATVPFFGIDKTYLRLGVSPSFYGDDWDFESSSFRIPVRLLAIHQPSVKWTLIAGVGVFPDYDDTVVPILGFIYKPNDKLLFHITPDRPYVSYAFNGRLTGLIEGGMSYDEFEVDNGNHKNVVLKYQAMRLGTGVEYTFNKHVHSSLSAGGVFNRRLEYKDDYLGKVVVENGAYCEFRVNIRM